MAVTISVACKSNYDDAVFVGSLGGGSSRVNRHEYTVERLRDGALFTVAVGGYFDHAQGVLVESTAAFTSTSYRKARIS